MLGLALLSNTSNCLVVKLQRQLGNLSFLNFLCPAYSLPHVYPLLAHPQCSLEVFYYFQFPRCRKFAQCVLQYVDASVHLLIHPFLHLKVFWYVCRYVASVLIWSLKLSNCQCAEYLDGWLAGNTGCHMLSSIKIVDLSGRWPLAIITLDICS